MTRNKFYSLYLTAILCVSLLSFVQIVLSQDTISVVKIMFMGDSITEGGIGTMTPYGYISFRTEVENGLRAAGIASDFIGTYKPSGANPLNPLPDGQPGPMFDQDNDGYPGRGVEFFLANIKTVLPDNAQPDYVIFLLGANDMYEDVDTLIIQYELLWDAILGQAPKAHIIVSGNVPNLEVPDFPVKFNALLEEHVAERAVNGQAFSYVDPQVLPLEMADNLHPNAVGQYRMGIAYTQKLLALIYAARGDCDSRAGHSGDAT